MLDELELLRLKDRGMMKWQGLILSEHQEALDQLRAEYEAVQLEIDPQDQETVRQHLKDAYTRGHQVALILSRLLDGQYEQAEGLIEALEGDSIFVDKQWIPIEEILRVTLLEPRHFWQENVKKL